MGWTTIKPDFKEECLLVTATRLSKHWDYAVWIIEKVHTDEGSYMGCHCGDGDEWGDLADLTADEYLILPKHNSQNKAPGIIPVG